MRMKEKDFLFLGLHDLSKETFGKSRDIISRDAEIESIRNVLENVIFSQDTIKQALTLIGKSGCGKSTIINFFKQKYDKEYEIVDFSGNYIHLQAAMTEKFSDNIDAALTRKIGQGERLVLILDQFERFFYLKDDAKKEIRDMLRSFARKNTAIILSMREEYLSVFLNEFDVNDMKSDARDETKTYGVLRDLVSIIKDSTNNIRNKNIGTGSSLLSYKNQDCKNNVYVHLECPGFGSRTIIEKMGVTLFYCENQNDSVVTANQKNTTSIKMLDKCERIFGVSDGREFFEKHKKRPLIEQQIIFHMAEFEKKENGMSHDGLKDLYQKEDYALLSDYFDRQIASCNDYFNAERLLYLLSSARINHVSMKKVDLEAGLFERQFNEKGNQILDNTLRKLQELQLIKQSIEASDIEYEIAHDFIATSFLNYSSANISRHVKNALDLYMAEYLDNRKEDQKEARRKFNKEAQENSYYKVLSILSMVIVVMIDIIERFIFNPFETIWKNYDPYGTMSVFAPIITLISIWYLCRIYDKFVKFYRGKKALFCKILYIPIMFAAIGGELCYPHILAFDGISLGLVGLNVAFLLQKDHYYEASEKELFHYGLKCSLMGFVYALFHIAFAILYQNGFPFLLMVLETVVLWLLVAYAQLAHMTKDFLYSRRMDVTCEKL